MLSFPNLDYLAVDDPILYDAMNSIVSAFNQLQKQVGVDAAPSSANQSGQTIPAPNPPASISVTAPAGTKAFVIHITPSPGAAPGILYFLEVSDNTGFTNNPGTNTVYQLGNTLVANLSLGAVTRYFRVRATYPSSGYSLYAYFGTAANPTALTGN
jgi:hypothetical protein